MRLPSISKMFIRRRLQRALTACLVPALAVCCLCGCDINLQALILSPGLDQIAIAVNETHRASAAIPMPAMTQNS